MDEAVGTRGDKLRDSGCPRPCLPLLSIEKNDISAPVNPFLAHQLGSFSLEKYAN